MWLQNNATCDSSGNVAYRIHSGVVVTYFPYLGAAMCTIAFLLNHVYLTFFVKVSHNRAFRGSLFSTEKAVDITTIILIGMFKGLQVYRISITK